MDPIEVLMSEHRLIKRVLAALEVYVEQLGEDGANPADLERFADFIAAYADVCHHGKEEEILFRAMMEHGFPNKAGPIAVMLSDHDEGRRLVAILRAAAGHPQPWSERARHEIKDAAITYTHLLRIHIDKEDGILYPMARGRLPEEAMGEVAARFDEFEKGRESSGEKARVDSLGQELLERYAAGFEVQ